MQETVFNYIVVGAGSAGCALAARLSEDPDCRVLLVEAGGQDDAPDVRDPVKWPTLFPGPLDWGYQSTPMQGCHGRVDHVPRAKMLGGCHSHNASVWVRGAPGDFDRWAADGCHGWAWSDVEPIFRRIEAWQGAPSERRGTEGPIFVAQPDNPNPVGRAFVEAGPHAGLPISEDYNSRSMIGTTFFDMTIKDGSRFTVADGYLRPAMDRPNLTVWTGAEISRLLLEGTTCVGIEMSREGTVQTARANQEVILSAGVIGSPCILMRSGIGPGGDLKNHGIDVVVEQTGVGQNLQDHVLIAGINYECHDTLPAPHNNGAESTLWAHSDYNTDVPDIQAVVLEFPFVTPDHAARLPSENCYAIAPSIVQPESRGSVRLTSSDPSAAPAIDVNFLGTDRDMHVMRQAMQLCRELGQADSFAGLRKREVIPGDLSASEMMEFLKYGSTTYFHPVGTCRMGSDDESVVDPQLRVRGVQNLRVADASIMPTITCGNTNAPSIMIGEKCADLIRGL